MIKNGKDIIQLSFDSRCADCGCSIPAGSMAEYRPSITSERRGVALTAHRNRSGKATGTVHHWAPAGEHGQCGTHYTVKALFTHTSLRHAVDAYTAAQAVAAVTTLYQRKRVQPVEYCIYQGDFMLDRVPHVLSRRGLEHRVSL